MLEKLDIYIKWTHLGSAAQSLLLLPYQSEPGLHGSIKRRSAMLEIDRLFVGRYSSESSLLTLNVRGPSYLGLTRSISGLLMPWLLTSPGHRQPWYWLYRLCRSYSYLKNDFKYLCQINVKEWRKMQMFMFSLKNLALKGLIVVSPLPSKWQISNPELVKSCTRY